MKKEDVDIFEEILKVREGNKRGALVTVVETEGSTPQKPGAKMIVLEDKSIIGTIGGGIIEKFIIDKAVEAIKKNKIELVHYALDEKAEGIQTGMICGGNMRIFIEPLNNISHFYIFGAGHIGRNLYKLAILNGFKVYLFDDVKEHLNKEIYTEAQKLIYGNFKDTIPAINFYNPAYILIATKSHISDEIVLYELLKQNLDFKYLGMIASKNKAETIKSHLKDKGISEELLNKVKSPAGINIKSKTPFEIAISVMAEVINIKNSTQ